jgi:cytochrome c oxidase cbb3-type subunit 3
MMQQPAAAASPAPPAPATLPPGAAALSEEETSRARALAAENCGVCHGVEMLTQQRLTLKQWQGTVKKMRGWGALLTDEEANLLARHLAAVAGPGAGPDLPPAVSPRAAAAALAPEPDGPFVRGDATRGRQLYASDCAACHGPEGRGESPAPNLTDRPLLYRAAEFARVTREGKGLMPEFTILGDRDVAALLAYLRAVGPAR